MQAALGLYAEFDIYSGCKLGSTEAAGTALTMVYSSDGTQIYVLTAVSAMQICTNDLVVALKALKAYIHCIMAFSYDVKVEAAVVFRTGASSQYLYPHGRGKSCCHRTSGTTCRRHTLPC